MLRLFVIVALLALVVPAVAETTMDWDYYDMGDSRIYWYMFSCGADEDLVTSVHVYAPVDWKLLTDWTADDGWRFEATVDEETGGTDMCWYTEAGVAGGLAGGGNLMVTVSTPRTVATNEEYALPGCGGNWGYEVAGWAGSVAIMPSSVAVPQSMVTTPEPSGVVALVSGLGAILAMRRRRV